MNWAGYERKTSWPIVQQYSSIFMEGLRKPQKSLFMIPGFGPNFEQAVLIFSDFR
jgi:hypothetical protein